MEIQREDKTMRYAERQLYCPNCNAIFLYFGIERFSVEMTSIDNYREVENHNNNNPQTQHNNQVNAQQQAVPPIHACAGHDNASRSVALCLRYIGDTFHGDAAATSFRGRAVPDKCDHLCSRWLDLLQRWTQ